MSTQSHCSQYQRYLRGGGIYCVSCCYIHIICRSLASGREYIDDLECRHCAAKGAADNISTFTLLFTADSLNLDILLINETTSLTLASSWQSPFKAFQDKVEMY